MTGSVSPIGNIIGLKGQAWAESASGVRPLEAGATVFEGEKILTGPDSSVEIRFLDDTCLSQGADSTLSLDEYVYNPADEAGSKLGFGLLEGAFRHVSGKIAVTNPENVQLESPLAVIGIRGTVTVHSIRGGDGGEVHGVEHISDGHRVIIQDTFGEIRIINDPLTVIDLSSGLPMGFIRPMTPQELEFFQSFAPNVLDLMGMSMTPEGLAALLGGAPGEAAADSGEEGDGDEAGSGAGEEGSPSEDAANADSTGDSTGDSGGDAAEGEGAADPTVSGGETPSAGTAPGDGGNPPLAGTSTTGIIAYADQSTDSSDSGLFAATPQLSGDGSSPTGSSAPDLPPPPGVTGSPDSSSTGAASSYPEQEILPPPPQEPTGSSTPISDPANWEFMNSGGHPNYSWLPAGYDSVPGTDGSDTLNPGAGGPYALFGFGGDDYLSASANHIFYGGAGNDVIVGSSGADTIYGGTGDDVVKVTGAGHAASDIIDGGAGSNTLLLEGGSQTENVFSSDANLKNIQFIELLATGGASGIDLTAQSEGFTIESNTDRAAVILAGSGGDTLVGGSAYQNTLDGGAGNDLVVGGDQSDTISGGAGIDTIEAGGGDDWIWGSAGADSIDGQGGTNTLNYYYSDAAVHVDLGLATAQSGGFAAGDQLLNITNLYGSSYGNDTLIGTDDANTLGGSGGDDSIQGWGGDDWIEGSGGSDILLGGEGNDFIQGDGGAEHPEDGNDTLSGMLGNDVLYGRGGDDILIGGLGGDFLYGEAGGDRFIYDDSDHLTGDSIDGKREAATLDRIGIDTQTDGQTFDFRLNPAGQLASVQYVDRIDVRYDVSDLTIVLGSDIAATADSNGDDVLGDIRVEFRDGIGAHSQATSSGIIVDASGLSAGQSLFFEGEGYVDGGQLHAGFSGDDTVTGGAGNDTIFGGLGADSLIGGDGSDRFWYYTPAALEDDIVDGSEEQSTWDRLVIAPQSAGQTFDFQDMTSVLNIDRIDIASDVEGTKLVLGSQIAITADNNQDDVSGDLRVDFRDQSGPVSMTHSVYVDGSDMLGTQSLYFQGEGYLDGGQYICRFDGNDTVLGGAGNDSLEGGVGNDELDAGPGNDTLRGGLGNDSIYGGDGDDSLIGGDGSDTLESGQGVDAMSGGAGSDVFLYSSLEGSNTIDGVDVISDFTSGQDIFRLVDLSNTANFVYRGTGLFSGSDAQARLAGNILLLDVNGDGTEDMRIQVDGVAALTQNDFVWVPVGAGPPDDNPENWETLAQASILGGGAPNYAWFTDQGFEVLAGTDAANTGLTLGSGAEKHAVFGFDGNDSIDASASSEDNYLFGGSGNDTIHGSQGQDTIYGGTGDDSVVAGEGGCGIDGGMGTDTADFSQLGGPMGPADFAIDLSSGTAGGGSYSTYTIANVENVVGHGWKPNDILGDDTGNFITGGSSDDNINGGGGADVINGGDGVDIIYGDVGNDTLRGEDGGDLLYGEVGDDSIEGGIGDDFIDGGDDNDVLAGDAGNDVLHGGNGDDDIDGGEGNDTLYGESGNDTLLGGAGTDWLEGGDGNDSLDGGDDEDHFLGGAGNDTVIAGSGNDTIYGDAGSDSLLGGTGNDTIYGGDDNDILDGGEGDDSIIGGEGDDEVWGSSGADTIDGGGGNNTVDYYYSTAVSVDLRLGTAQSGGWAAGDILSGIQNLYGSGGNDTLIGTDGANSLGGSWGDDYIVGLGGDDWIDGAQGNDTIDGGAGNDYILAGGGDDWIDGADGDDEVRGDVGADTINGGSGNDSLDGQVGDDMLYGGVGADTLHGGSDHDILEGGAGSDSLIGGSENDEFVYTSLADSRTGDGVDTIADFTSGEDKIRLVQLSAKTTFVYQGTGAFSGTDAQARLDGDTLRIDVDGDGNEDMQIHFSSAPTLVQGDFVWEASSTSPWLSLSENTKTYFYDSTSGEFSSYRACAALRSDGSVVTWGNTTYGGDSSAVASQIDGTIDVVQIYGNHEAFAALRLDGSVVTWGSVGGGGNSSAVADMIDGTVEVTDIFSTWSAFAALRVDGSVVTWGSAGNGGDSSSVSVQLNGDTDVVEIFSSIHAFAALREDGSVVTWGNAAAGGDSSAVAGQLNGGIDVVNIAWTTGSCAALRADGSVVTWGNAADGGDSGSVAGQLDGSIDVQQILSTDRAFAALRVDGSVITWGRATHGGDSSAVAGQINGANDVVKLFSAAWAFAALRADGSVVTWGDAGKGGDSSAVAGQLDGSIDVVDIFWNGWAFAALRADGSVVTWGDAGTGGDSSSVAAQLDGTIDVVSVFSTSEAFAALRADGSVVTWGLGASGGDSSAVAGQINGAVDVVQIFATAYSFAALRADGSLITWGNAAYGGDSSAVAGSLTDVVWVASPFTDDVYTAPDNPDNWETMSSGGHANYEWLPVGYDTIIGTDGTETLNPAGGPFAIFGFDGEDLIEGDTHDDLIYGGAGDDALNGGSGNDTLYGGSGNDDINGGEGNDSIFAGDGDDYIYASAGADTIDGGTGNNTVDYLSSDAAVNIDLRSAIQAGGWAAGDSLTNIHNVYGSFDHNDTIIGTDGDNSLGGSGGDDSIEGLGGNDWIEGALGSDTIYGGAGNDTIRGDGAVPEAGDGNDLIYGGEGNDSILGGAGNDTLIGGDGADTASYDGGLAGFMIGTNGAGRYTVIDINPGDGDEGADELDGIESVQFADSTIGLKQNGEFQVNTYTPNEQVTPSTASLIGGGFVITWASEGQDGDFSGIFAQRYSADGSALGYEFQVNTHTVDSQNGPSIAALNDGGFLITWASYNQDTSGSGIFAQRYAADGSTVGSEFQVNTHTANSQTEPAITSLAGGGFVITWASDGQDGDQMGIFAQRYAADGSSVGGEFQVSTQIAGMQYLPSITALIDGGFVVTWASYGQDGSDYGIFAQRFAADGSTVGGEFQVNTYTANNQYFPVTTALADGGFVVAWGSFGRDGDQMGIFSQRYAADGSTVGGEFQVNTYTTNAQTGPSVASLDDGGFVIVWQSLGQLGSGYDIFAQRYAADGSAVGSEFQVNSYISDAQDAPWITSLSDGGFMITWESTGQDGEQSGIFAQRYEADGTPVEIAGVDGDAGANMLTWDGTDSVVMRGLGGNDTLIGSSGNDTLYGTEGDDHLNGGLGTDILSGGDGSDRFIYEDPSELSGDTINGGEEQATLDYLRVAPTLTNQTFNLSTASIQYIDVIEVGSDVSGTKIVLGSQIVATADLEQDGSSEPGEGEITVYFYNGTLHTTHMTNGVYIDGTDLTSLQSLFFEGPGASAGGDYYAGFDGNDTVLGGAGADDLSGGLGNDSLDGRVGNDELFGGAGADTLHGGDGADVFFYQSTSDSTLGAGDVIADFDATADKLQFDSLLTGTFAYIGSNPFSNDGDSEARMDVAGNTLYVDTNGDGNGDMQIELTGVTAGDLETGDFIWT